jgi:hypothetical protein
MIDPAEVFEHPITVQPDPALAFSLIIQPSLSPAQRDDVGYDDTD